MASNFAADAAPPPSATGAVLLASEPVPEGTHEVSGVDFDRFKGRDITATELVENMVHMGFQGSAVAEGARIMNDMVGGLWGGSMSRNDANVVSPSVHTVTPRPARRPPSFWGTLRI